MDAVLFLLRWSNLHLLVELRPKYPSPQILRLLLLVSVPYLWQCFRLRQDKVKTRRSLHHLQAPHRWLRRCPYRTVLAWTEVHQRRWRCENSAGQSGSLQFVHYLRTRRSNELCLLDSRLGYELTVMHRKVVTCTLEIICYEIWLYSRWGHHFHSFVKVFLWYWVSLLVTL